MTTLKEALDQLAKGHELDNEQKKLIIDKWQKELGIQPCEDAISRAEALKAINKMDIPEDMSVFEIKSHIGVEIGTLPPVQPKPKTGHCKDCKYFEYDHFENMGGIPLITAHKVCKRHGLICKTDEDGYCHLFEHKAESEET